MKIRSIKIRFGLIVEIPRKKIRFGLQKGDSVKMIISSTKMRFSKILASFNNKKDLVTKSRDSVNKKEPWSLPANVGRQIPRHTTPRWKIWPEGSASCQRSSRHVTGHFLTFYQIFILVLPLVVSSASTTDLLY